MDHRPKYNPAIHHRRSIRLKGYDYSQAGAYFVTFCMKDRACLLGEVVQGKMILSEAGQMVDRWWQKIPEKFPNIELDAWQVMPNHFHGIVVNTGMTVGAAPCVRPDTDTENGDHIHANEFFQMGIEGEHMGSPLRMVVGWFKTMSTNEYIRNVKNHHWTPFDGKLWQRNYYEHIIRNEQSLESIRQYIINNPVHWEADKLNRMNRTDHSKG